MTQVTVVGGTAAVSQAVEDLVAANGATVTRLAGPTRYDTARAVADHARTDGASTAYLATGLAFAYDEISERAEDLLGVTLIGGSDAVTQLVEQDVRRLLDR